MMKISLERLLVEFQATGPQTAKLCEIIRSPCEDDDVPLPGMAIVSMPNTEKVAVVQLAVFDISLSALQYVALMKRCCHVTMATG